MFEKIYAFVLLLQATIVTQEEYTDFLNGLFIEKPTNELLLELEFASNHFAETLTIINEVLNGRKTPLNYDVFGSVLFENIKKLYEKNSLEIEVFYRKAYNVWKLLPDAVQHIEPFWTLLYADDCLSYGDEAQTRKLYEAAFAHRWNI